MLDLSWRSVHNCCSIRRENPDAKTKTKSRNCKWILVLADAKTKTKSRNCKRYNITDLSLITHISFGTRLSLVDNYETTYYCLKQKLVTAFLMRPAIAIAFVKMRLNQESFMKRNKIQNTRNIRDAVS